VTILQFREILVRSLLLGMPFKKLKSGRRQKSTDQTKRKLTDHKLEKKKGSVRIVRRHCAGCYEKIRQQQSREASNATAKKIKPSVLIVTNFFVLIVSTRSITPCNK
jgi:hypothetical protein